jgi:hypothetical protein
MAKATGSGSPGRNPAEALAALLTLPKAAADALTEAFKGLAGRMAGFVQAFAPGVVDQLNVAFRNLQATVGQALAPALSVMVDVVREVTETLGPIMADLAPVFADLARTLADILTPVLRLLAPLLQALVPVIKFMSEVFGRVLQDLVRALILTVAWLSKFIGTGEVLRDMLASLRWLPGRRDVTAAPQNAGVRSIEEMNRTMQAAAFAAQGAGRERGTNEFLADIIRQLEAMETDTRDLKSVVLSALNDWWEMAKRWIMEVAGSGGATHLVRGWRGL